MPGSWSVGESDLSFRNIAVIIDLPQYQCWDWVSSSIKCEYQWKRDYYL